MRMRGGGVAEEPTVHLHSASSYTARLGCGCTMYHQGLIIDSITSGNGTGNAPLTCEHSSLFA